MVYAFALDHTVYLSFQCISKTLLQYFFILLEFLGFFLLLSLVTKGVCFGLVVIISARISSVLQSLLRGVFENLLKRVLCIAQDPIKNFTLVSSLAS